MESQFTAPLPPKPRPRSTGDVPEHAREGNGHPNGDDMQHERVDLDVSKPSGHWVMIVGITGAVILVVLLAVGLLPRLSTNKELAADAEAALNAPVPVTIVTAHRADSTIDVFLPGTLRPWQEVSLFARTTGYLKKYNFDISEFVKKGDVMAEIDSPEVDQQLRAAKANLDLQQADSERAKFNMDFAKTTWDRFEKLKGTSGVTELELDTYRNNYRSALANYHSAEANVGVAKANVQQLTEMQAFEKIVAPFDGVVTSRTVYPGAMILANPTSVDTQPMFKLADNLALRAFINVPQNYSLTITQGMEVSLTARERPERVFTGKVLGTTNYLDLSARSLLVEVRIENKDRALLPGMYIQATFHVTRDHPPLVIPAPALVINADGKQVAIVKDNKVHFQKVDLGVDFGNDIEIVSGLTGDEQIIGNPGEKTVEGAEVKIATDQKNSPPPQSPKDKPEKVADVAK